MARKYTRQEKRVAKILERINELETIKQSTDKEQRRLFDRLHKTNWQRQWNCKKKKWIAMQMITVEVIGNELE